MYRKTVRRRRAALVALLAASIVLLTIYFGESANGGLHAIQRGAQEALAPIEEGTSRVLKPFRDLVRWVGDVLGAQGENERLRGEVEGYRKQLARAQTDRREAEQLRGLVGLREREGFPEDVELLTARVIARSPTVWYSSVKVDKGSRSGVRVDQPAISAGGLAGRVSAVTGGAARITLIADSSSAVSAQVMPDGASGVVRPEVGNPSDMLLDFVEKDRRLSKGAVVVTSGSTSSRLESLFPRGIPIGSVTEVDQAELDLYQRVHLKPYADFRRMDFVQVLVPRASRGEQRAEVIGP